MLKRILVGVAGTASTAAKIAMTVDIARRHDATVSLLSVIDRERLARIGPVPMGGAHYAKSMRDDRVLTIVANADAAIERFIAACREAGVGYEVVREHGAPLDVLAGAWRTHDLCILGLRGWFTAGVVAEPEDALFRLLRQGVRPILAVSEQEPATVSKILVAYDGSPEAAKAMKRSVQMRLWGDASIHLTAFDAPDGATRKALDEAIRYVNAHGLTVEVSTSDRPLTDAFESEADRVGAEVLGLGIRYRASLLGNRFDARAATVVRTANRPVFLSH